MSSTLVDPSASGAAPSFSPSPSSTPNNGSGSSMQRGANYFFGFLITFVALLLIFVGCGVGSRRRTAARRRAMMLNGMDGWGDGTGAGITQTEPSFWEPKFADGGDRWDAIMPLSMTLSRPKGGYPGSQPTTNLSASISSSSIASHTITAFSLPSWMPGHHRCRSIEKEKPAEKQPPEAIQVAVMIAMPSPTQKQPPDKKDDETFKEYQIGVARVPWDGTELS